MSIDRGLRIARHIYAGNRIDTRFIADTFGVSSATAKRDMHAIEAALPVKAVKERNRVYLALAPQGGDE